MGWHPLHEKRKYMTTPIETKSRSYGARIDAAMDTCLRCRDLDPTARAKHKQRALAEIVQTQARTLTRLPAHAWPEGRPFR
jgi:hypothetical protein